MKSIFCRGKSGKLQATEVLKPVKDGQKEITTQTSVVIQPSLVGQPSVVGPPAAVTILDSLQQIRKRINNLPCRDRLLLGALEVVNSSLQDRRRRLAPNINPETAYVPGLLFTLKEIRSALKSLRRREANCCRKVAKEAKKETCCQRKKIQKRKGCPCSQRNLCKHRRRKKCRTWDDDEEEEEEESCAAKEAQCGEACQDLIRFLETLEKTAEAFDWLEDAETEKELCDIMPQSDPMECAPCWFPVFPCATECQIPVSQSYPYPFPLETPAAAVDQLSVPPQPPPPLSPLRTSLSPSLATSFLPRNTLSTFPQSLASSYPGANSVYQFQPPFPPSTVDPSLLQMDPSFRSSASPSLQVPPPPPPQRNSWEPSKRKTCKDCEEDRNGDCGEACQELLRCLECLEKKAAQQAPLPSYPGQQQGTIGPFSTGSIYGQGTVWTSQPPPRPPPPYCRLPPFGFPPVFLSGYRRRLSLPGRLSLWSPWGPLRPSWPDPQVAGFGRVPRSFTVTLQQEDEEEENQPDVDPDAGKPTSSWMSWRRRR